MLAVKNGNKERLDPETVAKDNLCELGQWLYGEGKSLMESQMAEYQELVNIHANFHREMGLLVAMVNGGQGEQAYQAMDDKNSRFSELSEKIIDKLKFFQAQQ